MQNKYNLGDRVCGNKTGAIISSTIIGILEADYFLTKTGYTDPTHVWEKFYPDFKDKPIYICRFDKPEKTFTFEEMLEQLKEPLENRPTVSKTELFLYQIQNIEPILRLYYKLMTPEYTEVGYPEEDLIKLDDLC